MHQRLFLEHIKTANSSLSCHGYWMPEMGGMFLESALENFLEVKFQGSLRRTGWILSEILAV